MRTPCRECGGKGWVWERDSGPGCIHGEGGVCDGCLRFLERIVPALVIPGRKQPQEDVAMTLGYTPRHVRRMCSYLGYHGWSEFYADVAAGRFLNLVVRACPSAEEPIQFRRPA